VTPRSAVATIARSELRRRWRAIAVLGVLAGLVGGVVLGLGAVARRTATAADRLDAASNVADASVLVVGDRALAEQVAALPGVAAAQLGTMGVGRIDGPGVAYVSVLTAPERSAGLSDAVIVAGRSADAAAPDEAVVSEDFARQAGVHAGDVLVLDMLAAEELTQFDTGFGEPDGPRVELTITGIARLPPGEGQRAPVRAGPAFAVAYGDAARAGWTVDVRLADGAAGMAAFSARLDELSATLPPVVGGEEFPRLGLQSTAAARDAAAATSRVITTGLVACLLASALAGGLAFVQAIARHQSATTDDQQVEAALGCTAWERAVAHALPSALAAVVAALVAGVATWFAGHIEPPGAAKRWEPHPGAAPNVAIVVLGAVGVAVTVVAVALRAAHRAGRRSAAAPARPSAVLERAAARTGRPWAVAGAVFALVPGSGARGVPVRASLVGAALGVAGVAAVLTASASLDRLVDTPERWGWRGEVAVIDATDAAIAELAADARVAGVSDVLTGSLVLGGAEVSTYALADVPGRVGGPGWTILDGRDIVGDDEIVLGSRLAERLGVGVADHVPVRGADVLTVVGIGLGPNLDGEALGDQVQVSPATLSRLSTVQPFREALVDVAPGVDLDGVVADLGRRYELAVAEPPRAVADLAELGRIPDVLALFLGAVAALALAHALVLTTRRRAHDLAVLRALGFTPRDTARAVATLAVVVAGVGLGIGLPLGLAVGRLVWGSVAASAHVATDPVLPLAPLALVAAATVAGAVGLAIVPAGRAARLRPARVLRDG
jgi:putative ABC transport system permease protein